MTNLGTLGDGSSFANDINNAGDVVGYVQATSGPSPFVAFLSGSDGITDLNTLIPADSGWSLWFAAAINDNGQVVGSGTFNGEPRAFLLTPGATSPDPMIPLPPAAIPGAALLILLAGRYARGGCLAAPAPGSSHE
jgi:probable HAF family extracellular repeat protein